MDKPTRLTLLRQRLHTLRPACLAYQPMPTPQLTCPSPTVACSTPKATYRWDFRIKLRDGRKPKWLSAPIPQQRKTLLARYQRPIPNPLHLIARHDTKLRRSM